MGISEDARWHSDEIRSNTVFVVQSLNQSLSEVYILNVIFRHYIDSMKWTVFLNIKVKF
jgi:hypothetical protein